MKKITILNKEWTLSSLYKMSKQAVVDICVETNKADSSFVFEQSATRNELIDLLKNTFGVEEETQTELPSKVKPEDRAKQILGKAREIQAHIDTLPEDERESFIESALKDAGLSEDDAVVKDVRAAVRAGTDLPASDILSGIPIRVVEQQLVRMVANYSLFGAITSDDGEVRNGIKQIFYKDFRDADATKGTDDVVIGDYNMGMEPVFSEHYRALQHIHKGYDIVDSMLNDATISMSLFIALVNDFAIAITKPIAKVLYAKMIDFLEDSTSYDEEKIFTAAATDTKDKAKELYTYLASKQTTSRDNLTVKPLGAAEPLEYEMSSKNMILIMDVKESTNYKYDLNAMTFNLGEINIPVAQIVVVDFDKVAKYGTDYANSSLKTKSMLIVEKGAYHQFRHYTGTKKVDTPKLKQVVHQYVKVGEYRRKDKLISSFKNKA